MLTTSTATKFVDTGLTLTGSKKQAEIYIAGFVLLCLYSQFIVLVLLLAGIITRRKTWLSSRSELSTPRCAGKNFLPRREC